MSTTNDTNYTMDIGRPRESRCHDPASLKSLTPNSPRTTLFRTFFHLLGSSQNFVSMHSHRDFCQPHFDQSNLHLKFSIPVIFLGEGLSAPLTSPLTFSIVGLSWPNCCLKSPAPGGNASRNLETFCTPLFKSPIA